MGVGMTGLRRRRRWGGREGGREGGKEGGRGMYRTSREAGEVASR